MAARKKSGRRAKRPSSNAGKSGGARSKGVIARDKKVISTSYTRGQPVVIDRGSGARLWDVDGKGYLDFTAGIAVSNVGHANPDVVRAVKAQADKILHNAGTDFYNELEVKLAEKLVKITPGREQRVFFTNSGTESVECAFKLARWKTGRSRFISFFNSFHGRTYASMTLSGSKTIHRNHFGPLVPGVVHVPYAYCYRCPFGHEDGKGCGMECLSYIEDTLLKTTLPADEVAGVFFEPVQGEGGYVVPPKRFLTGLRKICRDNGFLMIADEIQTGFGRSGKWFASQHFGIKPDIMCLAKGIAGGMPLGACVAHKDIMQWPPGAHASTFSGNPVSCAASLASISYIERHKLMENAARLGRMGLKYMKDVKEDCRHVGDVRGLGLMIGVEMVKDKRSREPAPDRQKMAIMEAFRKGLLLLYGGKSTIRIAPPLVIGREEFQDGLETLAGVLKGMK
ncbi:MAG: acetyl ornithine aminotransferase family protein [Candidatus Aenigmatarchaeota archaeon]|nr:MAG: acetyl ornithine aminotransferase family protein [Candidatus Aenigmarchaeota archaeon]